MEVWIYYDKATDITRVFETKEDAITFLTETKKQYEISLTEENAVLVARSKTYPEFEITITRRKVESAVHTTDNDRLANTHNT
jgi:hypothetical protein